MQRVSPKPVQMHTLPLPDNTDGIVDRFTNKVARDARVLANANLELADMRMMTEEEIIRMEVETEEAQAVLLQAKDRYSIKVRRVEELKVRLAYARKLFDEKARKDCDDKKQQLKNRSRAVAASAQIAAKAAAKAASDMSPDMMLADSTEFAQGAFAYLIPPPPSSPPSIPPPPQDDSASSSSADSWKQLAQDVLASYVEEMMDAALRIDDRKSIKRAKAIDARFSQAGGRKWEDLGGGSREDCDTMANLIGGADDFTRRFAKMYVVEDAIFSMKDLVGFAENPEEIEPVSRPASPPDKPFTSAQLASFLASMDVNDRKVEQAEEAIERAEFLAEVKDDDDLPVNSDQPLSSSSSSSSSRPEFDTTKHILNFQRAKNTYTRSAFLSAVKAIEADLAACGVDRKQWDRIIMYVGTTGVKMLEAGVEVTII